MAMETKVVSLVNNPKYQDSLFKSDKRYIIPEYQRPYSWEDKQLEDFIDSLERSLKGEEIFMGTVQFAKSGDEYHIIDGQQRITTFLLFYRLLDLMDGEEEKYIKNYLGIMEIRNFSSNQKELDSVLSLGYEEINVVGRSKAAQKEFSNNGESRYLKNIRLMKTLLIELFSERNLKDDCDKKDFIKKLHEVVSENVYFVELVTEGIPLPQVVGIFNTINTTGLDLDCSDLFKLQYYEYLKNNIGAERNWIKEISDCYDELNDQNISMSEVLDVYKHCIVAKLNLGLEYLQKSNETFFEEIFSDKKYNANEILEYNEFKRIVGVCSSFFKEIDDEKSLLRKKLDKENRILAFAEKIIGGTRYPRYWTLPYVYAVFKSRNSEEESIDIYAEALRFALCMAKYFIVFSVAFDKMINPVQTYVCGTVLPCVAGVSTDKTKGIYDLNADIKRKTKWNPYASDDDLQSSLQGKVWFEERISGNIFENGKRTRILCTLSALIEEVKNNTISQIIKLLYDDKNFKYDMDHVYARRSFEEKYPDDLKLFNSIGNLVVLEAKKNRSIQDCGFAAIGTCKDKDNKFVVYKSSAFRIVKDVAKVVENNNYSWDKCNVEIRLKQEMEKINNFIFA